MFLFPLYEIMWFKGKKRISSTFEAKGTRKSRHKGFYAASCANISIPVVWWHRLHCCQGCQYPNSLPCGVWGTGTQNGSYSLWHKEFLRLGTVKFYITLKVATPNVGRFAGIHSKSLKTTQDAGREYLGAVCSEGCSKRGNCGCGQARG